MNVSATTSDQSVYFMVLLWFGHVQIKGKLEKNYKEKEIPINGPEH